MCHGSTVCNMVSTTFFLKGERLNGQSYHDQLLPFYKEESERLFGHKNWGFPQDGASSHTADKVQKWCKKNFKFFIPKEKWSSNSPELSPLIIPSGITSQIMWNIIKSKQSMNHVEKSRKR